MNTKQEIHKKIDTLFLNLINSLVSLVRSSKSNTLSYIEDINSLEFMSSIELSSKAIEDIMEIVYNLKIEALKRSDVISKKTLEEGEKQLKLKNKEKELMMSEKIETFNSLSNLKSEIKNSKFYTVSISKDMLYDYFNVSL